MFGLATGVTVWDSGWYYCEVENDIEDPITLKHNLQVLGNRIDDKAIVHV